MQWQALCMCGSDVSWLRGAFKLAITKAVVAIQTVLATRNQLSSLGKMTLGSVMRF